MMKKDQSNIKIGRWKKAKFYTKEGILFPGHTQTLVQWKEQK